MQKTEFHNHHTLRYAVFTRDYKGAILLYVAFRTSVIIGSIIGQYIIQHSKT